MANGRASSHRRGKTVHEAGRDAWEQPGELGRAVVASFRRHELLVLASAISFRALVALVPLTLLALGLLGALGLRDVWSDGVAPAIEGHVTHQVYAALDSSAGRILSSGTAGLIALASALSLWHMTLAVAVAMKALNRIHDVDEERPWWRLTLVAAALAIGTALCILGAVLLVALLPRAASGGGLHWFLLIVRWFAGAALLSLAVGLLVRYAPVEHPAPRWASLGTLGVIVVWIVLTVGFRWWVSSVANFKTATGMLTAFLLLNAYLYASTVIFLAGAEVDEVLRRGETS